MITSSLIIIESTHIITTFNKNFLPATYTKMGHGDAGCSTFTSFLCKIYSFQIFSNDFEEWSPFSDELHTPQFHILSSLSRNEILRELVSKICSLYIVMFKDITLESFLSKTLLRIKQKFWPKNCRNIKYLLHILYFYFRGKIKVSYTHYSSLK